MTRKMGLFLASTFALSLQSGGCNVLPTVAVDVPLTGGSGTFDVQAGVPTQKSGNFAFNPGSVSVGRGSLSIGADAVSVTPTGNGGGKILQTTQQAVSCTDACSTAGVDGGTCSAVCGSSQLSITVRIAATDNADRVCEDGTPDSEIPRETYGPYLLQLDANGNVESVTPSSVTFGSLTVSLLNAGEFSVCIDVISPIDASLQIDNLIFNVGL